MSMQKTETQCTTALLQMGDGQKGEVVAAIASGGPGKGQTVTVQEQDAERYQADRALHGLFAQLTSGISPVASSLACIDWAAHLAAAPQRQIEIAQDALRSARQFFESASHFFSPGQGPWSLIKPAPQDKRFARQEWENPPFNLLAQAFLLREQWWHKATTGVRGVAPQNEAIVEFSVRQMLDMFAPTNFAATDPRVLQKAFQSDGQNFVFGRTGATT